MSCGQSSPGHVSFGGIDRLVNGGHSFLGLDSVASHRNIHVC